MNRLKGCYLKIYKEDFVVRNTLILKLLLCGIILTFISACTEKPTPREKETSAQNILKIGPETQKLMHLQTASVVKGEMPEAIQTTGEVKTDINQKARIRSIVNGKVLRVFPNIGTYVKKGDVLAVIESQDIGDALALMQQAKASLTLAEANLKRKEELFKFKVAPLKDVEKAQNAYVQAEAGHKRAVEQLNILGIPLPGTTERGEDFSQKYFYRVDAPLSGAIIDRNISSGEWVTKGEEIFSIADLSRMWIYLDIYPDWLSRVRPGQEIIFRTDAGLEKIFKDRIDSLSPDLNPETMTALARVSIENTSGLLKPGMKGIAQIVTGVSSNVLIIPATAIQKEGAKRVVFIKKGDTFEKREVEVIGEMAGKAGVRGNVKEGEEVVVSGAYQLQNARAFKSPASAGEED